MPCGEHAVRPPCLADAGVAGIHQRSADGIERALEFSILIVGVGEQIVDGFFQALSHGGGDLRRIGAEARAPQKMGRLARVERIARVGNERLKKLASHRIALGSRSGSRTCDAACIMHSVGTADKGDRVGRRLDRSYSSLGGSTSGMYLSMTIGRATNILIARSVSGISTTTVPRICAVPRLTYSPGTRFAVSASSAINPRLIRATTIFRPKTANTSTSFKSPTLPTCTGTCLPNDGENSASNGLVSRSSLTDRLPAGGELPTLRFRLAGCGAAALMESASVA